MKTIFKVLGIIIIVVLFLMLILPVLFHKQIMDAALKEANKQVDARIEFTDYGLSLFRSFPNFNLQVEGLSVSNKGEFEGDTLAKVGAFEISIGLFSVFGEDGYEIRKIELNDADIRLIVNEDGKANWDIAVETEEEAPQAVDEETPSDFKISIKQFQLNNAYLVYDDRELDMRVVLEQLDHRFSGDLSADFTSLKTRTTAQNLLVHYEGVDYLNNVEAQLDADIDADLKNSIYTLKDNELNMNELLMNFSGSVGMLEDGYDLMLTFDTPKNRFRELLSLVPAIYHKEFEDLQTQGDFSLNGSIKGIYRDDHLPSFDVRMEVDNAMFKYPELPSSVNNIRIDALVRNPGGDADKTEIRVNDFHMEMAGNPVDMTLLVKTPVSDPFIDGSLNGNLNLANISKIYPLDSGQQLSGEIRADISLKGNLSSIEQEKYEDFQAYGSLLVSNMKYANDEIGSDLLIKNAQLNFSPEYIDLVGFKTSMGNSDLTAKGKITGYLGYFLADDVLQGELSARSEYLNLNELMPESTDADTVSDPVATDTAALELLEIPKDIDFVFEARIDKLIFQDMEITNAGGEVIIRDQALILDALSAEMLEGEVVMNGRYSTKDTARAELSMNIRSFNISNTYEAFSVVQTYAPFAANTNGEVSADLSISSLLNRDFTPVLNSLNGSGGLETSPISINNLNTFNRIQESLNLDLFKKADIGRVDLSFEIRDGKLEVKPFDFKLGNTSVNLRGTTAFDQSIDYTMKLEIPSGSLGAQAGQGLSDLMKSAGLGGDDVSVGESIPLSIGIGGTLKDPKISADLMESFKGITKDVKEEVKEQIEQKKEEIKEDAKEKAQEILNKAEARATEVMEQAKKQAARIRTEAEKAADKVRSEADAKAENLVEEGKKKGMLAEAAAKKAAQKLRDEADQKANRLIEEGDQQAKNILKEAQQKADQIRNEASQKIGNQ